MIASATQSSARWPRSALNELTRAPKGHLPALDGLRALAVLLVICGHWVYEWVTVAHQAAPAIARWPVFHWGWTGVDLFFVLSGFLIGKQLWGELYRTGSIDFSRFFLRRGLRIWPLYYSWIILLALVGSKFAPSWPDWVMLSNYVDSSYNRGWSLSTEEQFYILMPSLLLLFRRFVPQRWWLACVLALLATVPLVRALTYESLIAQGLAPAQASARMYSPLHLHCEPLLSGLIVAWISIRRPDWLRPRGDGRPAARVMLAAFGVAATGIALRTLNREAFAYVALGFVYGSSLCVALADRSILTAALRWRGWYLIARLSFGMYLNHLILREPTDTIIKLVTQALPTSSVTAFLAGMVLTIAGSAGMAAVAFVMIEQPGLALRDRWMGHHRATIAPAAHAPVTR